MKLSTFIGNEMNRRSITTSEMAAELDVSYDLVNKILKGRRKPSLRTLRKMSPKLNIPLNKLLIMTYNPEGYPELEALQSAASRIRSEAAVQKLPGFIRAAEDIRRYVAAPAVGKASKKGGGKRKVIDFPRSFKLGEFIEVPLMANPIGAGLPREVEDHETDDVCLIHRSCVTDPANLICVRIEGDSMCPCFHTGSIIAINMADVIPEKIMKRESHFVVLRQRISDGPAYVLRTLQRATRGFVGVPENPACGEVFVIDDDLVSVFGRIEWAWNMFNE